MKRGLGCFFDLCKCKCSRDIEFQVDKSKVLCSCAFKDLVEFFIDLRERKMIIIKQKVFRTSCRKSQKDKKKLT